VLVFCQAMSSKQEAVRHISPSDDKLVPRFPTERRGPSRAYGGKPCLPVDEPVTSLDVSVQASILVALPSLGRALDSGLSGLQWIVDGYILTLVTLLILGGSLADRHGRWRMMIIGLVGFGATSIACGLAPTTPSADSTDFEAMIKTVVEAEQGAIEVYNKLAKNTAGRDPVTYELIVHILGEEIEHEDEFENLMS
jgi:hypothetical protein